MKSNDVLEISEILERDQVIYHIMRQCPYEILRGIKVREYKADAFVLSQGEVYDTIYLIVDGELDIYVESEHGKKYYLNTYRKGNYIGELEMFGPYPYISSVEAKTDVRLFEIARKEFLRWLQMDQNLNDYFVRTLCESSYVLCNNMGDNTLYTLKQRICRYLIDSAVEQKKAGPVRINIRTENLGERMAVTQRSVNRVLQQLREKGLIEISGSCIGILDLEEIRREMEKS
ncbi:Crp/Fnr family transcriptional regulator [Diplocloster agilis]|uniref:Crp/Fnr family transcriptional regulator n=1 Tax=Diplocloster agilis TaxID=2850323 RepID=A0A949NAX5_9FIRM|nr:Crp/Fnr family transcriptional regulator [Diplocloster agilis]MBU9736952.1 Crp/Fnr family transcriptional regulator [Diplocloster agilis]